MAVEWLASGEFRHHYFGSWDPLFQFPVYTAVIAVLYGLGFGTTSVLVFQVLCGTLVAYLASRIALHLLQDHRGSHAVASGAALLIGLNPFLAYYQVRMIHPFAWDMLLATSLVLVSFKADPARRSSLIALAALGGLTMVDRPTLIVFMLPFLITHWRFVLKPASLALKGLLLLLLAGPILLWLHRAHTVTGKWQLTSVTDQMIWIGMQEETEGSGHMANGGTYLHLLNEPERHAMFQLDPAGRAALFRAKWKAEEAQDKGLYWRMFLVKLKSFWLYRSHLGHGHSAPSAWFIPMYKGYAIGMFILTLTGAVLGTGRIRSMLIAVVALSVLQCLFYFETRHRLLAEPILILVACSAVALVVERITKQPDESPTLNG